MPRVKRGVIKSKKRRNTLQQVKGYRFGRKSKKRQAYEAIQHAGTHAFRHRKQKKSLVRGLWQNTINYAVRELGLSYSVFMKKLKDKNILLNRKALTTIVQNYPETFERIVKEVK